MELEIVRRIRGNVHGTIEVTPLEDRVFEHWIVQRLRRIKQLAFLSFVFPGATHSRFEHSLGVMHLAGQGWDKLHANQKRLAASCQRYKDFAEKERKGSGGLVHGLLAPTFAVQGDVFGSAYAKQALRLAGLLHDLGHPPFSHSGERFLPTWTTVARGSNTKSKYLQDYLKAKCDQLADRGKDPSKTPVRHEVFTLLLVDRVLNDVYSEHRNLALQVAPRDVLAIIAPEIGPEPRSELAQHGVYKLCNELISGEFDLDRMDYLLRDSRECGVVYGIFDATRILDSLCVYHDPLDSCLHLAITFSGLAAFEDYLGARYSMYLQVYFHKTGVAAEAMLGNLSKRLGGWHLPADIDAYAAIDEHNIDRHLEKAAETAIKDTAEREQFNQRVDDLLKRRKLWKRVYEAATTREVPSREVIDTAMRLITEAGFDVELVSSTSALTNFKPRDVDQMSRNYLRLVKKDELQFPRVVPIEDFSSLIAANNRSYISRLYVEDKATASGRKATEVIRQLLTDNLR